jgi:anthranilate synthase component 1
MIHPDYRGFTKLARQGNWAPVWTTVPADLLTPVSAYLKLTSGKAGKRTGGPAYSFLLESVEGGETIARYTYLGVDPVKVLRFWIEEPRPEPSGPAGRIEIISGSRRKIIRGDFISIARRTFADIRSAPVEGLPPFTAGGVGYIGYDMVSRLEPVPLPPRQRSGKAGEPMPDAVLMFTSKVLVFDHVKHQIWIFNNVPCGDDKGFGLQHSYRLAQREIRRIERRLAGPLPSLESGKRPQRGSVTLVVRSNFSKERFMKQVRRAKQYIQAGDVFQVVLSQRLETKVRAEAFDVYRSLRRVNPAPYLFFLQMGEDSVLGSSPEMLVKITGEDVEYRPIAGTRPRGADAAEDRELERELLADEKERAEHIMLVDLGRNDVGRVARYGTVRIPDLMFVERYSHVMHLVSSVRGKLRKDLDAWDAFWACFPAGTVTGAPKVRAMQIISELEPTRRGLYAGSVLYFDLTGNLNSCIAIRSIVIRDGKAIIQVGAGIVADSIPEREFEETMNKGKAMLKAIELAERAETAGKRR